MFSSSNIAKGKWAVTAVLFSTFCALVLLGPSVFAYDRYNDGCFMCHGAFTDGLSPKGTVFPGDSKHFMHRNSNAMNTDCNLCHTSGDNHDPFIGSSNGTANNPGVGCTGCHGRNYGGNIGNSGIGLRAHHITSGIEVCNDCHTNDPPPLLESIFPTYYNSPDTNVNDPCNSGSGFLENWSIGDLEGLDNDGDGLYDTDDPDCSAVACPWDLDQSGTVGTSDLLELLGQWGTDGPADFDESGLVGTSDLLILLTNWGPCE